MFSPFLFLIIIIEERVQWPRSPFQHVLKFSQNDFRSERFVPYWTADAESLVVMNEMMLVMVTLQIVQVSAGRAAIMNVIVDHIVAQIA